MADFSKKKGAGGGPKKKQAGGAEGRASAAKRKVARLMAQQAMGWDSGEVRAERRARVLLDIDARPRDIF